MRQRSAATNWLIILALLETAAGIAVIHLISDRAWWGVVFLYGPRWIWLSSLVWLIPALRRRPLTAAVAMLVCVVLWAVGIAGWSVGRTRQIASGSTRLRVMTINAEGGHTPIDGNIISELHRVDAEVVVVTECGSALIHALEQLHDFELRNMGELCLLSRDSILNFAPNLESQHSLPGAAATATIRTSAGVVNILLVHLPTPRDALDQYGNRAQLRALPAVTRQSVALQRAESEKARALATGDSLPIIVAGDFNLPVESDVYRSVWGSLRNCFSETGWGTGYTKHTRHWGVRIDHVLAGPGVEPLDCYLGRDVGSDHLPLIADLALATQRTNTAR